MSKFRNFVHFNNIVKHGEFQLSSGLSSKTYVDGRSLTLDHNGLNHAISELETGFADREWWFEAVGGPVTGACPLITGIMLRYGCKGFYIRKQAKDHGLNKLIEGPVKPHMRVVLVEDTTTTGESLIEAIKAARDFGLKVAGACSLFDRDCGVKDRIDVPFFSLMTIPL